MWKFFFGDLEVVDDIEIVLQVGAALQLSPVLLRQHLELWILGQNQAIHDLKFPFHHEVGQWCLIHFQSSHLEFQWWALLREGQWTGQLRLGHFALLPRWSIHDLRQTSHPELGQC